MAAAEVLKQRGAKRVFVVISDAFRFEAAAELVDELNSRSRVKARLVNPCRRHGAQAASHLDPEGDATQQVGALQLVALCGGQTRRNHHRPCMHRPTLVGIVEILAMGRDAVDEGGRLDTEALGHADHRAGTRLLHRRQRSAHVVFTARGDADAGNVHQQAARHGLRLRVLFRSGPHDRARQTRGNGLGGC